MPTTTGVVVGWNEEKGYGFVRPSEGGGADVFVHRLDITNAIMLSQGQRVSFDIIMDERKGKHRAAQLRVIDNAARTAGGFDTIAYDNDFLLSS